MAVRHRLPPFAAVAAAIFLVQASTAGRWASATSSSSSPRQYSTAVYDEDGDDEDVDADEFASSGERDLDSDERHLAVEVLGPRRGRHAQLDASHTTFPVRPAAPIGWPRVEAADKTTKSPVRLGPHVLFESEGCPAAPPTGACGVLRCASNADCAPQRRCCFNGCTTTCLPGVDPPPVVDWEEETPDVLHPEVSGRALYGAASGAPQRHLIHSHGAPELVVLVGGCTMPQAYFRRLEDFKAGGHVRRCSCSNGAVVCQVRTR